MDLEYKIKSANGIHARPAGCLAKFAKECPDVNITISHLDKECDVKNVLSVMRLGIKQDDTVIFRLNGPDQEKENEVREQLNGVLDNLDNLNSSLADS